MTELTILMPCLNEAATVGTCIAKARDFLQRTGIEGEVLVADNGSDDGPRARAARPGGRGGGEPGRGGAGAAAGMYVEPALPGPPPFPPARSRSSTSCARAIRW